MHYLYQPSTSDMLCTMVINCRRCLCYLVLKLCAAAHKLSMPYAVSHMLVCNCVLGGSCLGRSNKQTTDVGGTCPRRKQVILHRKRMRQQHRDQYGIDNNMFSLWNSRRSARRTSMLFLMVGTMRRSNYTQHKLKNVEGGQLVGTLRPTPNLGCSGNRTMFRLMCLDAMLNFHGYACLRCVQHPLSSRRPTYGYQEHEFMET